MIRVKPNLREMLIIFTITRQAVCSYHSTSSHNINIFWKGPNKRCSHGKSALDILYIAQEFWFECYFHFYYHELSEWISSMSNICYENKVWVVNKGWAIYIDCLIGLKAHQLIKGIQCHNTCRKIVPPLNSCGLVQHTIENKARPIWFIVLSYRYFWVSEKGLHRKRKRIKSTLQTDFEWCVKIMQIFQKYNEHCV